MKQTTMGSFCLALMLGLLSGACSPPEEVRADRDESSTLTDIDGNRYSIMKIGKQEWTGENFRATRLNDGTHITFVDGEIDWADADDSAMPAICYYENGREESSIEKYGALYNWHTVQTGKLAPEGWRIPTESDWEALDEHLASEGIPMSGFAAHLGGYRYHDGGFDSLDSLGMWWSSTKNGAIEAVSFKSETPHVEPFYKGGGLSVRLVRK